MSSALPNSLLSRVLDRLGVDATPPSLEALHTLYAAWCQRVPFDNVRKLVSIHEGAPAPFPGSDPVDFLEGWLKHGTGGTCWAGTTGLFSVLHALGYEVERCIATMMAAPNIPPNHGSTRVRIDGAYYLVDSSILSGEPLPLSVGDTAKITHPAWGLTAEKRDGLWHIAWRPLHKTDGFECRYDAYGAEHSDYQQRYEDTRGWSPFNYQLTARRNRGDEVLGASFGNAITLGADGSVRITEIDDAARRRMLIEDFGMSEEIISRLPADRPTPPPPGSKSAGD